MGRTVIVVFRSLLVCAAVALLASSAAQAASTVDFTLDLQDANGIPYSKYVCDWKTSTLTSFPPGQSTDGQTYDVGDVITWDAMIAASGTQDTSAGAGFDIYGVSNYVFDLEIRVCLGVDGNDACTDIGDLVGTAVFVSRINDGTGSDPTREAAFAVSYDVGAGPARIIDPGASGGPNLAQYNASLTTSTGALIGLGAGYGVPWTAPTVTPGIGMVTLPDSEPGLGIVPVEEGQIDTSGMPAGTYVLKLIPDDPEVSYGMNVLRGDVNFSDNQLNAYATGAEVATGDTVTFFLQTPVAKPVLQTVVSRKTHTGAGDYNVNVGIGDVESRSAQLGTANPNELTLVTTFNLDVGPVTNSDVISDVGTVSASKTGAKEVTVTLTNLPLNTQLNLAFPGVIDGNTLNPVSNSDSIICVRVIAGDYDNTGRTNFSDFDAIRTAGYLNQSVNSDGMARADFDCNGRPNFLDFAKVKNDGLIDQTAGDCCTSIGP